MFWNDKKSHNPLNTSTFWEIERETTEPMSILSKVFATSPIPHRYAGHGQVNVTFKLKCIRSIQWGKVWYFGCTHVQLSLFSLSIYLLLLSTAQLYLTSKIIWIVQMPLNANQIPILVFNSCVSSWIINCIEARTRSFGHKWIVTAKIHQLQESFHLHSIYRPASLGSYFKKSELHANIRCWHLKYA